MTHEISIQNPCADRRLADERRACERGCDKGETGHPRGRRHHHLAGRRGASGGGQRRCRTTGLVAEKEGRRRGPPNANEPGGFPPGSKPPLELNPGLPRNISGEWTEIESGSSTMRHAASGRWNCATCPKPRRACHSPGGRKRAGQFPARPGYRKASPRSRCGFYEEMVNGSLWAGSGRRWPVLGLIPAAPAAPGVRAGRPAAETARLPRSSRPGGASRRRPARTPEEPNPR